MQFNKKAIVTVIAGATLLLGAAVAGAQENVPPAPGNEDAPAMQQGRPMRDDLLRGEGRELVERYTGMEIADVADALRDGETLASLIEANGGDVNAFIDEAVALGEASIDEAVETGRIDEDRAAQMKENLREGIEMRVNGEYPLLEQRGDRGRPGAGILDDAEVVALVEEYTGLTPDEVLQAVRDGETLASLIEANGGDVDAFIDEAIALIETRIDERIGARGEQMKENIRERVTAFVNGERPQRPRR